MNHKASIKWIKWVSTIEMAILVHAVAVISDLITVGGFDF